MITCSAGSIFLRTLRTSMPSMSSILRSTTARSNSHFRNARIASAPLDAVVTLKPRWVSLLASTSRYPTSSSTRRSFLTSVPSTMLFLSVSPPERDEGRACLEDLLLVFAFLFGRPVELRQQDIDLTGFHQVIVRPLFHSLDCRFHRCVAGEHDHLDQRMLFLDSRERLEPIHLGHLDVK